MQTFTPFPLRARGSVELFDAAIKLYKQYFWVLMGWSAIYIGASLLGAFLPMGGMASLFITPIAIGSAVCCVAAAVRGQSVEFGQCWRFTQPRYWPILGLHLLAFLCVSFIFAAIMGVIVAVVIAGVYAFRDASGAIQITMGVLAFVVLGTIATVVGTVFFTWMGLVPIVVCMEEDKRNMAAMGRAYELLKGHWIRITTLMAFVGLATLALLFIIGGTLVYLVGLNRITEMAQGRGSGTTAILALIAFLSSTTLLQMLWTPLYNLILTLYYLDVRVRQEALDLEWTAHRTAPPIAPQDTFASMQSLAPQTTYPQMEYPTPAPTTFSPPTEASSPIGETYGTRRLDEFAPPIMSATATESLTDPFVTPTHEASVPTDSPLSSDAGPDSEPTPNSNVSPPTSEPQPSPPSSTEAPRPQW